MNAKHFEWTVARRLSWFGPIALGVLMGVALACTSASGAGEKSLDDDSVTVPADLAWVPADAAAFITLRPESLWNSAEGKILREQFPDLTSTLERDVGREVGLKPAELASLTIVMADWSVLRRRSPAMTKPGEIKGERPGMFPPPPPPIWLKNVELDGLAFDWPLVAGVQPQVPDVEPSALWIATAADPAAMARYRREIKDNAVAKTHEGKTYYTLSKDGQAAALYFVDDHTFVRGSTKQILKGLSRTSMETKGPLAPALRLAKEKHHLAAGLQLTPKQAADLLDDINQGLGRDSLAIKQTLLPLFRALAAAGFANVGKETRAEVQLFFRDGTQATASLPAVEDALALVRIHGLNEGLGQLERELEDAVDSQKERQAMFGIQIVKQLESGLRRFRAETKGGLVRVEARALTDMAALAAKTNDVLQARAADESFVEARNRRKSLNNLRDIGAALQNFHSTYKRLPPAEICDGIGIPLLSWRVAILPYLGHKALYDQFKFDEPWNSKHNIKLLDKIPKVFAPVGVTTKEPGQTYYQGFLADPKLGSEFATAWETTLDEKSPLGAWGARIPASFPGGTSNTIWVVEAGNAVPWTKPVDLPYDPGKPLPKLGGMFKDGFSALFVDGSARFLPRDGDEKALRQWITRAVGQPQGQYFEKW
jgi:hypothetical protein